MAALLESPKPAKSKAKPARAKPATPKAKKRKSRAAIRPPVCRKATVRVPFAFPPLTKAALTRLAKLGKRREVRPEGWVRPDSSTLLPLWEYDIIVVALSGGKDSIACLLEVLRLCKELGIPKSRVEAWHQCVDGAPGSESVWDWPISASRSARVEWTNGAGCSVVPPTVQAVGASLGRSCRWMQAGGEIAAPERYG